MYVASVTASEHRVTLETLLELTNALADDDFDPRDMLINSGFSRAPEASAASMHRVTQRLTALEPFMRALPDLDVEAASTRITEELTDITISPSIVDHGDVGPHIHWTPSTARFDDQMMADILMALAQEVCDNATIRFGACGADGCTNLFYDATRNRSKRFCSDSRCASRTHTADHRARQRDGE